MGGFQDSKIMASPARYSSTILGILMRMKLAILLYSNITIAHLMHPQSFFLLPPLATARLIWWFNLQRVHRFGRSFATTVGNENNEPLLCKILSGSCINYLPELFARAFRQSFLPELFAHTI